MKEYIAYLRRGTYSNKIIGHYRKRKNFSTSRQKQQVTYKGTKTTLSLDFLTLTLTSEKKWSNILKIVKEIKYEPRILCPTKLAFKYKGDRNCYQHLRAQEILFPWDFTKES